MTSKIPLASQGFFNEKLLRQNFEQYASKHNGSLDGMLVFRNDLVPLGKSDGTNKYNNAKVFLKYIPFPDVEPNIPGYKKNQQFDLKVSYTTYTHGNPYSKKNDYSPELKVAKYKQSSFDKFNRCEENGFYTSLKDGEQIVDSDLTDQWVVRQFIDKFVKEKAAEFKLNKKWGKGKGLIPVPNFEVKSGFNLKVAETDEEKLIPDIRYKFTEDDDGYISHPDSESRRLKIFTSDKQTLTINRANINKEIPSKTKIKLGVSYNHVLMTKQGICLGRYVNKLMLKELPKNTKEEFDYSDDDSEKEEKEEREDDDESD